ncbi:DUF1643 domain-containing protein [Mycobacterium hackensackense]|uniref:DUF1643 domain-containing protein n=1 Tax=Mycobacterium hackensackense TaxID=228909 RepID=UPI002265E784|nr:DUF1643 domain-containing protein [Mycobacterium hackensackense]MCV7255651.1 DUF1643 domain-containing protein [Mycobacterium hackensackense]
MTNPTGTILSGLISSATMSDCGTYRYRLTRIWDESKPVLAWVMLNPSTADGSTNDPTIRRCIAFAKAWGFGGITVVNLYALRATDPKQLWQHADPVGPDNDAELANVAECYSLVMLAWGSNAAPGRAADVLRILSRVYDRSGKLAVLGWTKGGQPRHPLYVRADTHPVRADIPPSSGGGR